MIWVSDRKSIEEGQISVLALIETLVGSAAGVLIYFYFDTLNHIVVSALIAPFLLMRTPSSVEAGLWLAIYVHNIIRKRMAPSLIDPSLRGMRAVLSITRAFSMLAFAFFITVILFFVTKFITFLYALALSPIESFGRIPENWRKVVLCTDSATAPEIVPGIGELRKSDPRAALNFFPFLGW